jgi:phosphonate transport system substrate-binding protein
VLPLRLGVHPYLPAVFIERHFSPLVSYLAKALGREVELIISPDYHSHIMRMGQGELDLAYMGPAPYVKLVEEYGPFPLIARLSVMGEPEFNGVIFTREGSQIRALADLRGKRFAFGDPSSTMSHLVPLSMLEEAGVGLDDLAGHDHYDSHQDVALAVLRGKADAGAVKQEVFARYRRRGLRTVMLTPRFSEHLFVAHQGMPGEQVEALQRVFQQMHTTDEGREALHAIKSTVTAMVPVEDSDYDNLRRIIQQMREQGVSL